MHRCTVVHAADQRPTDIEHLKRIIYSLSNWEELKHVETVVIWVKSRHSFRNIVCAINDRLRGILLGTVTPDATIMNCNKAERVGQWTALSMDIVTYNEWSYIEIAYEIVISSEMRWDSCAGKKKLLADLIISLNRFLACTALHWHRLRFTCNWRQF